MNYSVAIRTLGTSVESLRLELESLHQQTILPEKIIIYIARGYTRPAFTVGKEEYVEVDKGMVSQRALRYKEISSEYILMLDDDVVLAPDSVERLIGQMRDTGAHCIAVYTFKNHKLKVSAKIRAAVGNLVFPRIDQKWAFKMHPNGSFSYLNKVKKVAYPSQSAAGPAALWRKDILLALRFEDEKWLDNLDFAYGEDELEFYKLHINSGRLFVSFDCGIENLDGKSSSAIFQRDSKRFYVRAISNYIRWHRMQYLPRNGFHRVGASLTFGFKMAWFGIIHLCVSMAYRNTGPLKLFLSGLVDGRSYTHSAEYKAIPPYMNKKIKESIIGILG